MVRSRCSICEFFKEASKRGVRQDRFNKLIAEGREPQVLQEHLRTLGLEVSRKTVRRHIQECTSLEIRNQRSFEKSHEGLINRLGKKVRSPFDQTWGYLFPREENLKKCPHVHTEPRMNLITEQVSRFCLDCGTWVGIPFDPEEEEKKRFRGSEKDRILYQALRERR